MKTLGGDERTVTTDVMASLQRCDSRPSGERPAIVGRSFADLQGSAVNSNTLDIILTHYYYTDDLVSPPRLYSASRSVPLRLKACSHGLCPNVDRLSKFLR